MAKKKNKKVERISPKIDIEPSGITYSDLFNGDCFIRYKKLWVKSEGDDQEAICLEGGDRDYSLCDEVVIPVDVEIKWTLKE